MKRLYRLAWEMPNGKTCHWEWIKKKDVVEAWIEYFTRVFPKKKCWLEIKDG